MSRRVAIPYRVLVAGAVGMFLLGANLTMLVLLQTGWIGANSPAFDPGLRAIAPTPTLWCPDHGGDHAGWMAKTLASHEPGLVIDVGAYDGKEAIAMARAGHRVLSFEPTPTKAQKIREAIKEAGLEVRATAIPLPWWRRVTRRVVKAPNPALAATQSTPMTGGGPRGSTRSTSKA